MRLKNVNPWGNELEAQRLDLWTFDLNHVFTSLEVISETVASQAVYFTRSVEMPQVGMTANPFRRDSRPYLMPGYDEALPPFQVAFYHLANQNSADPLYTGLNAWKARARAGRGPMSKEIAYTLDHNFKAPTYRFNVDVQLLKGYLVGGNVSSASFNNMAQLNGGASGLNFKLEKSTTYTLVNVWCSALKLDTLSHEGSELLKITATMVAEDVLPQTKVRTNRRLLDFIV